MQFEPISPDSNEATLLSFLGRLARRRVRVELRATGRPGVPAPPCADSPLHLDWRRWYPDEEIPIGTLMAWVAQVHGQGGLVVVHGAEFSTTKLWTAPGPPGPATVAGGFALDRLVRPATGVDVLDTLVARLGALPQVEVDFVAQAGRDHWLRLFLEGKPPGDRVEKVDKILGEYGGGSNAWRLGFPVPWYAPSGGAAPWWPQAALLP